MRPRAAVATLCLVLCAARAAADPAPTVPIPENVTITSPGAILDVAMKRFDVPRGTHILSPRKWVKLDTEVRRLQDAETRLTAENTYMRKRVEGWQPGWKTLTITALSAIATGVYLGHRL